MKGVDKIYGTRSQYKELYSWCKQRQKGIQEVCRHDPLEYFYDIDYQSSDIVVIADFPLSIDFYLLQHCDLEWVQATIKYKNKVKR